MTSRRWSLVAVLLGIPPLLAPQLAVATASGPTLTRAAMSDESFIASDSLRAVLRRLLAEATPERPVRIAHLGDSHSEQGGLAAELATRWSGAAPVSPAFATPYSRNLGLMRIQLSAGWQRSTWRSGVPTKIEGPSGSSAVTSRSSATMRLELPPQLPEGSRLTVWWTAPAGVSFHLQVDSVDRRITPEGSGRLDAPLEVTTIPLPAGAREVLLDRIALPARTELRIGGFTIDRPDARVAYDLLGLGATTQRHPLTREEGSLRQFLGARQPDIVVIWYGTNSVRERPFDGKRFRDQLVGLIQLVRGAAPQSALIVVGPPDLAERPAAARPSTRRRGTRRRPQPPAPIACPSTTGSRPPRGAVTPRSHANVSGVRDLMREVAQASGGAFLDPFALQGESGGMVRWYCAAPRLASPDLIHLTDAGYRHLARALADAIAAPPVR